MIPSVGPVMPEIADVRRPARKYLLVGGLNVGMRAENARDTSVKIAPKCDLFRRCFGMKIDKHYRRALAQADDTRVSASERIVDGRHKRSPHEIEDADGHAVDREGCGASTGHRRRIVRRPNHAVAGLEILAEVALIEDVVAAGDEVDAACEDLFGGLGGQAKTTGRVFAVGDAGVDVMLLSKERNAALEYLATGGTDDIPDDQEVERAIYRRADALAFF